MAPTICNWHQLAKAAQRGRGPFFVQFSPRVDGRTDVALYHRAWQYLVDNLRQQGVSNLVWVWEVPPTANRMAYYPGHEYIDWISVRADRADDPADLQQHYETIRADLVGLRVVSPVVLTAVNSRAVYPPQTTAALLSRWPEVRALCLHPSANTSQTNRQSIEMAAAPESWQSAAPIAIPTRRPRWRYTATDQVRGIAYNPGQTDWRDGQEVLTRRQLESDFQLIKKMGANTLRRYAPSDNDQTLLTVAHEQGLDVIYGFWLDPKIDYSDSTQATKSVQEVLQQAAAVRTYPAIAAWAPGSSTWHLLKYHFSEPHLSKVRAAYLNTVETIAQYLHALDARRPVTTAFDLLSETRDFNHWETACPSLDFISLNVRHPAQLVRLHGWLRASNPGRFYLISEFGARAHFDAAFVRTDKEGLLVEDRDHQKAALYAGQWQRLIASHPQLLGGVAYCWRDRLDISPTWHGITDLKGGLKPAYYALRQVWLGNRDVPPLRDTYIAGPRSSAAWQEALSFEVYSDNLLMPNCQYEWQLWNEDFREMKGSLQSQQGGKGVVLRVSRPGTYQLCLLVRNGPHVVTATRTVQIREGDASGLPTTGQLSRAVLPTISDAAASPLTGLTGIPTR